MEINHNSPLPLYHQVKELLSRKIAAGEWRPDEPIPPERVLMEWYGISRTTIRQAVTELVNEGRLYRIQGKGTFVASHKIGQTLAELTGFAEELRARGLQPEIHILEHRLTDGPPAAVAALETNDPVLLIRRVIRVNGSPLFTDESYVAAELASWLTPEKLSGQPIYTILEAAGQSPAEGRQLLEAALPEPVVAAVLEIPTTVPVFMITRTTFNGSGRAVEYTRAWFRSDRYRYEVSLRRGASAPLI